MKHEHSSHQRLGLGGVVATIFLAVIIVTTGVTYFTLTGTGEQLWRRTQYSQTPDLVVAATEVFTLLSTQGAGDDIVVNVTNHGSIPIRIVAVIVNYHSSAAIYRDQSTETNPPMPLTVNPGQTEGLDTNIPSPGSTYSIKILSERGNQALLPLAGSGAGGGVPPENVVTLRVAGNLTMSFFDIQWKQENGGEWTTWQQGPLLTGNAKTIWRVWITNNLNTNISISRYSVLMLAAAKGGEATRGFWIISEEDGWAGSISAPYVDNSIVILPEEKAWLYFGADGVKANPTVQKTHPAGTQAAAFFLFYGILGGDPSRTWGQNIPYQGVYTT